MKTFNNIIYSLLFFCVAINASAAQQPNLIEKRINKSFDNINANSLLNISNRYGDINIETSKDINKVTIEIILEAWHSSKSKAENTLSSLSISDNSSGNNISFKTNTPSNSSINDRKGFKITYNIKAPTSININLINKFGGIFSDDIDGKAFIEVSYGNLTIKELRNEDNEIIIKYGNGDIDFIEKASLDTKYLGKLNIGQANELEVTDSYGNINLGTAGIISGSSKYSNLNISILKGQLDYKIGYGNINIEEVSKSFSGINASSSYGSIKLNFNTNTEFSYEAYVRYGSFKSNLSTIENYYQVEQNTSSEFKGFNLKRNSENKVYLKASYGSLKIN
ncbi:DUF4097 family beta strand repeat-containing protein [Flammeovirga pacifica]|uniref:Adhesin domain-containing protein n=1 Tax=Flammeovirga pacifica TaxID=915059 RepID=A0A1S1YY44_FLAPC|nr:hypothetical protein [Flammeovirga pacifica]OHX65927.1 hypothetical protein NH26_05940 [Flammeovirga pacifica]